MKNLESFITEAMNREGMSKEFRKQLQNLGGGSVKPSNPKKQKISAAESKECVAIINSWSKLPIEFWQKLFNAVNSSNMEVIQQLYDEYENELNNNEQDFSRVIEILIFNGVRFSYGYGANGFEVLSGGNAGFIKVRDAIIKNFE